MNCPGSDKISDLLDGAVSPLEAWHLRRHISRCADCAYELRKEEQLRDRVRCIGVPIKAPALLRNRVAAVVLTHAHTPVRQRNRSPARWVVSSIVAGCLTLGLVYFMSGSRSLRPRPAYAQVVRAMDQIQTARWQEEFSTYNTGTGKSTDFTLRQFARLNPPTLLTEFPGGRDRLQTMETEWESGLRTDKSEDIAARKRRLREHILRRLIAPESLGKGPNAWQSEKVTVNGKTLFRFTARMGRASQPHGGTKLTAPGYRSTLWVDSATLRVVRSEQEYYDGQSHTRTTGSNFEYDLPLPANRFPK
ncbi:MAG: zf-HC2 domain-containing protein [Akkermansiaceae bacterium]|nr:zf-HC2 domain-containing protein [Armatimonadota bacterium]